jgi:hypothetical protein
MTRETYVWKDLRRKREEKERKSQGTKAAIIFRYTARNEETHFSAIFPSDDLILAETHCLCLQYVAMYKCRVSL